MTKVIASLPAFLLLALLVQPARADWGAYGASYSCDPESQRFAIMSDIDTSDGYIGAYEATSEKSITRLEGGVHKLECALGAKTVRVTVTVNPPNTHMCQGAGHSSLSSIEVDGKPLALIFAPMVGPKYPLDGTYACDQGPSPAAIKVIFEPEIVSVCVSPSGSWNADTEKIRCHSMPMRANTSLERTRDR
jgi:hypothetical protein